MKSNRFAFRKILVALPLAAFGAAGAQINTLSAEEQAAGYENLFDGIEALSVKWYGITGSSQTSYSFSNNPPSSWIIATENDSKLLQVSAGAQNHMATRDSTYRNFDLKTEWRVPTQGNSGIFIRFLKIASWGGASGPEAQVVDIAHSDGQGTYTRPGTMYDMIPLRAGRTNWFKPTGQWNEFRIIAYENRVAHYGNGVKLLEYDMTSDTYLNRYAVSKYRTFPRYKEVHAGSIYLQHHGEAGIGYRNLKIKKFTDSTQNPWAPGSPYLNAAGTELRDTLPMTLAMFPVSVAPDRRVRDLGDVKLSREGSGILIRLANRDDYDFEVRGMNGALIERHQVKGSDRFVLPVAGTPGIRMLTISAKGRIMYQRALPPL